MDRILHRLTSHLSLKSQHSTERIIWIPDPPEQIEDSDGAML